jgi:hypothetical protein
MGPILLFSTLSVKEGTMTDMQLWRPERSDRPTPMTLGIPAMGSA